MAEPSSPLPTSVWAPERPPSAVIVAVHGFNDHRTAFTGFGEEAAKRGVLVEGYDQSGFGTNANAGRWPGAAELARDLRAFVAARRAEHPGVPLFVLGESMGGAVTTLAFADPDAPPVDGLILSAPAVWQVNVFYRFVLGTADLFAPGMTFTGRSLGIMPSDNIEMMRALGADPLFIKQTKVEAISGIVDLMQQATLAGPKLRQPLLLLAGTKDQVIPPKAHERFVATLKAPDCTNVLYPNGWHMLLRDLQRQVVWDDILAWVAHEPLPSGPGMACGVSAAVAAPSPARP